MDPLTALALAGNALQFVERGIKVVRRTVEIYNVANGAPSQRQELATTTAQLEDLTKQVEQIVNPTPLASGSVNSFQKGALSACAACQDVTKEFQKIVAELTIKGKQTIWNSLKLAVKELVRRKDIEHLEGRVVHARGQLTIAYLLYMDEGNKSANEKIEHISKTANNDILKAVRSAQSVLLTDIESLAQTLKGLRMEDPQTHRVLESFYLKHETSLQDIIAKIASTSQANIDTLTSISAKLDEVLARIRVPDLRQPTTSASQRETYRKVEMKIVRSLFLSEITQRREQILPKHEVTLQWILRCSCSDHEKVSSEIQWQCFVDWMKSATQSRIYWISGKPGSGKSTLLRYLAESSETIGILQDWSRALGQSSTPQPRPTVISWFFWHSGTKLQRSLEGCLRSLLHQLFQNSRNQMEACLTSERWEEAAEAVALQQTVYGAIPIQLKPWTIQELLDAICAFVENLHQGQVFLFLLDGLDEIQGGDKEQSMLIKALHRLTSAAHVKVCVSSRPWNFFRDVFRDSPKLCMEKLNAKDIHDYVASELGVDPHFVEMQIYFRSRTESLLSEIVERSSGVFLWVYLVVRDLSKNLRDGAGMDKLTQVFEAIPDDLYAYFEYMMKSVEPSYQLEGSIYLQLRFASDHWNNDNGLKLSFRTGIYHENDNEILNFRHLLYVDERKPRADFILADTFKPVDFLDKALMEFHHKRVERRLNSRCLGLLEIDPSAGMIQYMHRTVKEFLCTSEAQSLLHHYSDGPFDTSIFALHIVTAFQINCFKDRWPYTLLRIDIDYVTRLWQSRPLGHPQLETLLLSSFSPLMNDLVYEHLGTATASCDSFTWSSWRWLNDLRKFFMEAILLDWTAAADLVPYCTAKDWEMSGILARYLSIAPEEVTEAESLRLIRGDDEEYDSDTTCGMKRQMGADVDDTRPSKRIRDG